MSLMTHGQMNANRRGREVKNRDAKANNMRRRAERRAAAEERNGRWAMLSAADKIAYLDMRLGFGVGASKQRFRLGYTVKVARNA